jgi:polysaccharide biosynthesis transport protein
MVEALGARDRVCVCEVGPMKKRPSDRAEPAGGRAEPSGGGALAPGAPARAGDRATGTDRADRATGTGRAAAPRSAPRSAPDDDHDVIDITRCLAAFARRKRLIGAVCLAAVGVTAVFTFTATPLFQAEALLLIDRNEPHVINIQGVQSDEIGGGFGTDSAKDYYNTQYQILASRSLAGEVLDELAIDRAERFLGRARPPRTWIAAALRWLRPAPVAAPPAAPGSGGGAAAAERVALVGSYLASLSVEPVRDSRLVRVSFLSIDPELSARIVNAHSRAYIRQGLDLRSRATLEARSFLEDSAGEIRARVERAQQALGEFRRAHDIVSLNDSADVVISNLAGMNSALAQAESERIARENDIKLVRQRGYDALPAAMQTALVNSLKQELVPLEREYAALQPAVTPAYSGIRALEAQIEQARRRLDLETDNAIRGMESAYIAAKTKEDDLRSRFEKQKTEALKLKDDSVQYQLLKQEVDTAMQLYDSVRQRAGETQMVKDLRSSNVSVIDEAFVQGSPFKPRPARNLALGAFVGLFGGLGLALLLDLLDGRLRTPLAVERLLRLPTLGVVPDLQVLRGRAGAPGLLGRIRGARGRARDRAGAREPLAPATTEQAWDAYRAIRTRLLLAGHGEPPRVLLFTSAAEGEGKTLTAFHTAIALAQLGRRVLLIDGDLRKPRCHRLLGMEARPGLAEAIAGPGEGCRPTQILDQELFFLASGVQRESPTELLGSLRMRELLAKLRDDYECIVIDAPPVFPISDALVLAGLVDGVVFVVDAQRSAPQLIQLAVEKLSAVSAHVLGVVLNRADPREGPEGRIGESYYG